MQIAGVVDARIGRDVVEQNPLVGRHIAGHGHTRDTIVRHTYVGRRMPTGRARRSLVGIVDVDVAVRAEVWIKLDAQQTTLAIATNVECDRALGYERAVLENPDAGEVDV